MKSCNKPIDEICTCPVETEKLTIKRDKNAPIGVPKEIRTILSPILLGTGISMLRSKNPSSTSRWIGTKRPLSKKEIAYEKTEKEIPACITKFSWLKQLDAEYAGIGDISNMSGLKNLVSVNLTGNNISDISPLRNLGLNVVKLSSNYIADASPVKGTGMRMMKSLDISRNPIQDIDFMKDVDVSGSIDMQALQNKMLLRKGAFDSLPKDAPANLAPRKGLQGRKLLDAILENIRGRPSLVLFKFNNTPKFMCDGKKHEMSYFSFLAIDQVRDCAERGQIYILDAKMEDAHIPEEVVKIRKEPRKTVVEWEE